MPPANPADFFIWDGQAVSAMPREQLEAEFIKLVLVARSIERGTSAGYLRAGYVPKAKPDA